MSFTYNRDRCEKIKPFNRPQKHLQQQQDWVDAHCNLRAQRNEAVTMPCTDTSCEPSLQKHTAEKQGSLILKGKRRMCLHFTLWNACRKKSPNLSGKIKRNSNVLFFTLFLNMSFEIVNGKRGNFCKLFYCCRWRRDMNAVVLTCSNLIFLVSKAKRFDKVHFHRCLLLTESPVALGKSL